MRVNTNYRTVIIQAYPFPEQERLLKRVEESALEFIGVSRLELQKMLYHRVKEESELSRRSLNLLAQRFTGSMGEKGLIPYDSDNSRFVLTDGIWYVEIQATKGKGNRIRIPIAKTEIPYYDCIQDLTQYPFYIVREDDKWFIYVSVPVSQERKDITVGIDFNLRRWVASPYDGQPLFFDAQGYSEKVDDLQRQIGRAQQKEEDVNPYYRSLDGIVKHAHGNFLSQITAKYGVCTLAIERIMTMYRMRELGSKKTNNWLYKKTALRQFVLRAMAKGFDVREVNPRGTSHLCHRCDVKGEIYGKHDRLFKCKACGLTDYNRDLNAARNIAKREKEELTRSGPREKR